MTMGATAAVAAVIAAAIERANERWGKFASDKGYTARAGHTGWARTVNPLVQGTLDGVAFTLEYVAEGDTTMALATPVSPHEGNIECTPEGIGSKLAKLFGAQDIIVGHDEFDAKYIIKSSKDVTAKAVLDGPTCDKLLGVGVTRFAYDDGAKSGGKSKGIVIVERSGLEERPEILEAMAAAAVHVAKNTKK